VTARESNSLLAFSTLRLRADPRHAALASVRVGEAPVGLALVRGGTRVVVADSNRFDVPGRRPELTVVDAHAALAHRRAVLGAVGTGAFPREVALNERAGKLLVTDFGANQVEAVETGRLP
jgi:DNA-binding beta-propeller fold protein YncE